jgi:hypothetical protein
MNLHLKFEEGNYPLVEITLPVGCMRHEIDCLILSLSTTMAALMGVLTRMEGVQNWEKINRIEIHGDEEQIGIYATELSDTKVLNLELEDFTCYAGEDYLALTRRWR